MAADLECLQQTRSNYIKQWLELSEKPKPSYSLDGQRVSWTEYQKFLTKQIELLDEQINRDDPYEFVSQGC